MGTEQIVPCSYLNIRAYYYFEKTTFFALSFGVIKVREFIIMIIIIYLNLKLSLPLPIGQRLRPE